MTARPLRRSLGIALLGLAAASCGRDAGSKTARAGADRSSATRAAATGSSAAASPVVGASDSAVVRDSAPLAAGPHAPLPQRSRRDSVALASMTRPDPVLDKRWPVRMPAPLPGAILPANRIIAYYGNPLVKRMGVLGEYPREEMLARLDREVAAWTKADPAHPAVPALHMVVTVAAGTPGRNGLYRTQMFDSLVNTVYKWSKTRKALFFVDVQVGKSTIQKEVPRLRAFLENPDVHLALDPEFAMAPSGAVPGKKIGTLDARDINWAVNFLDTIAREKKLPPKILVVHRFTRPMVTNASQIRFTPHVQVVMHMDGWGPPWLKFDSYHDYVKAEPVQFGGFKIFYYNDTKKGDPLLVPAEVLRLNPAPLYIQYQ